MKNKHQNKEVPVTGASGARRLQWVDHARGIAILFVVYRHVIVGIRNAGMEVTTFMYNLQEVVYNFRMPVFFVLSGIFISASLEKKSDGAVARNRVYTVLYPYLVWGSIMILLQIFFADFANSKRSWSDLLLIIVEPRAVDHLWYLLALFNTNILYLVLRRLVPNTWIHALIAIVLYWLSRSPITDKISILADLCYFYIYLFVGVKVSPYIMNKEKRESLLKFSHLLWLLPVVLVGQWFWFSYWNVQWTDLELWKQHERTFLYLFFIITLFACYFVYIIAYKISTFRSANWLAYLGKHSLYIYILHVFVAAAVRSAIVRTGLDLNTWTVVLICWIAGLLVPVAMYQLLKPFHFNRLFSLAKEKA